MLYLLIIAAIVFKFRSQIMFFMTRAKVAAPAKAKAFKKAYESATETVIFRRCIRDKARENAQKIGVSVGYILKNAGLSMEEIGSRADERYRRLSSIHGYDGERELACANRESFERYCVAFMINPADYIVDKGDLEKQAKSSQIRELAQALAESVAKIQAEKIKADAMKAEAAKKEETAA